MKGLITFYTILGLLLFMSNVDAKMCSWTDDNGVRHFSNAGNPTIHEIQPLSQVSRIWIYRAPKEGAKPTLEDLAVLIPRIPPKKVVSDAEKNNLPK